MKSRKYAIFTEKFADANGFFHLDYVLQNDDPRGAFIVEATNPATNEAGQLTTNVAYHGQRMNVDIFMKARGTVTGKVLSLHGQRRSERHGADPHPERQPVVYRDQRRLRASSPSRTFPWAPSA